MLDYNKVKEIQNFERRFLNMGKGNRTKQQQAASLLSGAKKKTAAKQTPTWVGTLIVVGVLVLALLACVFFALNSRGVFLRNKVVAKTEH